MDGIWIAAAITTALGVFVGARLLHRLAPASERRVLVALVVLQLPMCASALYGFRLPVLTHLWLWLASLVHPTLPPELLVRTTAFRFFRMFDAPLSEELAKLWPLLLPWFHRALARTDRTRAAMALGFGFGLGELWTVAWLVTRSPHYVPYPFYVYTGFAFERLVVCMLHGAFTATALRAWKQRFFLGLMGAMALHFIGNFPIFLASIDWPRLGAQRWLSVLMLWVIGLFMFAMALQAKRLFGRWDAARLLNGRARCPGCEQVYSRPFLAANLGRRRLERCRHCRRWHLVGPERDVPEHGDADRG
jgi:hypothetical protein